MLAITLSFLFVVGFVVVEQVLPYAGIKPMRRQPEDLLWLLPKGVKPENYGLKSREINIITPDSLTLRAILVNSNTDTALATVVLLHGISACKETQSNAPNCWPMPGTQACYWISVPTVRVMETTALLAFMKRMTCGR